MTDNCKIRIKEIFTSIQGEGPYIGCKQLFIRFCNCNLKCNYCDTDFQSRTDFEEYDVKGLLEKISEYKNYHSISLTGGEPLLSTDFLKYFLPQTGKKIYLETNATLADKLLEIKPFTDIISADIKLESSSGMKDILKFHERFFANCSGVETFAKIVFNNTVTDDEIEKCSEIAKRYNIELILQPQMNENKMTITSNFAAEIFDRFLKKYDKVRLIPQVHKFMDVR